MNIFKKCIILFCSFVVFTIFLSFLIIFNIFNLDNVLKSTKNIQISLKDLESDYYSTKEKITCLDKLINLTDAEVLEYKQAILMNLDLRKIPYYYELMDNIYNPYYFNKKESYKTIDKKNKYKRIKREALKTVEFASFNEFKEILYKEDGEINKESEKFNIKKEFLNMKKYMDEFNVDYIIIMCLDILNDSCYDYKKNTYILDIVNNYLKPQIKFAYSINNIKGKDYRVSDYYNVTYIEKKYYTSYIKENLFDDEKDYFYKSNKYKYTKETIKIPIIYPKYIKDIFGKITKYKIKKNIKDQNLSYDYKKHKIYKKNKIRKVNKEGKEQLYYKIIYVKEKKTVLEDLIEYKLFEQLQNFNKQKNINLDSDIYNYNQMSIIAKKNGFNYEDFFIDLYNYYYSFCAENKLSKYLRSLFDDKMEEKILRSSVEFSDVKSVNFNNLFLNLKNNEYNSDDSTNDLNIIKNEIIIDKDIGAYTRFDLAKIALTLNKNPHIEYFWGGKYPHIGKNPNWGKLKKIRSKGSNSYKINSYHPYGLDCSGFVYWVYMQIIKDSKYLNKILGDGTINQARTLNETGVYLGEGKNALKNLKTGDIGFYNKFGGRHVGIYIGTDKKNNRAVFIHCKGKEGVVLSYNICKDSKPATLDDVYLCVGKKGVLKKIYPSNFNYFYRVDYKFFEE
ncbi:MAG: C40 family peptidase [Peptostreptococcaceae bacterium]|nr:C40 family peptidase [Peptostreptococcaceae bacterium]